MISYSRLSASCQGPPFPKSKKERRLALPVVVAVDEEAFGAVVLEAAPLEAAFHLAAVLLEAAFRLVVEAVEAFHGAVRRAEAVEATKAILLFLINVPFPSYFQRS